MHRHNQTFFLFLLLAGAILNLGAGARRPWRERAILSGGHHTAVVRAADAVRRHVPVDARLAVMAEESHLPEAQGSSAWADQRLHWLLFPRSFDSFLREEDGRIHPLYPNRRAPDIVSRDYRKHDYLLFFRAGEPPRLPALPLEVLEREPMFVLVRVMKNMIAPLLGLASLVLLIATGWIYVGSRSRPLLPSLALAHLTGSAALAAGMTCGLAASGRPSHGWAMAGLAVWALAGAVLRRCRDSVPPAPHPTDARRLSPLEWGMVGLIALGFATLCIRLLLLPLDADGWAIWALKAKAMVAGRLQYLLTSPGYEFNHVDYPLLVPAHTWWLCAGTFRPKVAQLTSFLFFLDLLILFHWAAREWLSRTFALAGLVVILSWPLSMKHAVGGFADVPMAAFVFASVWCAVRAELRMLAPLLLGAALTKNEGLFTLVGVLVGCAVIIQSRQKDIKPFSVALAAIPAVASLVAWNIVKRQWGLHGDMLQIGNLHPGVLPALPARLALIAKHFILGTALGIGPRYPGWGFLWPLIVLGFGRSVGWRLRRTAPFWILTGAHGLGAVMAFLITPHDVVWHLTTALDRLLFHVAPVALLATLIALETTRGLTRLPLRSARVASSDPRWALPSPDQPSAS